MLLLGLVSPGCTLVYDVGDAPLDVRFLDASAVVTPIDDPLATPTFIAAEACNGRDDDGDGLVDEGYPDTDGDGVADCVAPVCVDLVVAAAAALPIVAACSGGPSEPVADPWSLALAWEWTSLDPASGADAGFSLPTVGQLDDDNGDGLIDALDAPDVIVQTASSRAGCGDCAKGGQVVALSGRSGEALWRSPIGGADAGVLVADIDGDQRGDVVAHNDRGELVALDGSGVETWSAPAAERGVRLRPPIVADLDGDGAVEIIDGAVVLDGASGATRFSIEERWPAAAGVAAVADADLDGHQEVYFQGVAVGDRGLQLWTAEINGAGGAWPVVVQADEDPEAEVAWIAHDYSLWDDDGTLILRRSDLQTTAPGAPCAGDLDDDGQVELVWADGTSLQAIDLDGSLIWRVAVGGANQAGCTTFDVDGDHAAEVIYADGEALLVLDGRTGTPQMSAAGLAVAPGAYPTVADVDNDGHADLLVAGRVGTNTSAVRVYRHAGDGWAGAGNTWPTYDYAVGNVLPDGAVPTLPAPYWTRYRTYRGRPAGDVVSRPDLRVAITDVCASRCPDGDVDVSLQVGNQGGRDQYAGGTVVLYAAAGHHELARIDLPAIAAGYALGGMTVSVPASALGKGGLVARIVDEGTDADFLPDCDLSNEAASWADPICP